MTSDPLTRLQRDYTPAFLAHLTRRSEAGLRSAYELGRTAIADGIGMLDLVHVHHVVFLDVAQTARDVEEIPEMLEAAAAFLVEALAPFEMTRALPIGDDRHPDRHTSPTQRTGR
jgi:Phosphoserine phosphatase RsbU, N-terminal domain